MGGKAEQGNHGATSPQQRLVQLLRPELSDIGAIALFAMVIALLGLATPVAVEAMVNTVAFGRFLQPLFVLSLILLTFLGFGAAFRAMQAYVAEVIQRRLFARVVANVAERLPRLRQDGLDDSHGPEVVNRFFDVMTVQKSASSLVVDGIGIGLQTAAGMVLLAIYHPFLLGFDIFLLAMMAAIVFLLGGGAVKSSIRESYAKYAIGHWLQQLAQFNPAFKIDAGRLAFRRADELTMEYLLARKSHFRILMRQIIFSLALQAIAGTLLLGLGGWLVLQGQLTLGQLVAAELVVAVIVGSFAKLGKQMETFYDLMAAVDKLGHLLDLPMEKDTGDALPVGTSAGEVGRPGARGVRLRGRDLEYRYGTDGPALRFPNFEIAPGEIVALAGRPGAGKSTLVDMFYALREPTSGFIEFDGADLRSLHPASVREQVALVREIEIFSGSLFDNVRLDRLEIGTDELRGAMQQVGLWEEVMHLGAGMETELKPGGAPLSRSQSARLMLARALVGRPRVLLIDGLLDQLPEPITGDLMRVFRELGDTTTIVLVTERAEVRAACSRHLELNENDLTRSA